MFPVAVLTSIIV
jgi:hypothetical protein